jgi:hypothetical protein
MSDSKHLTVIPAFVWTISSEQQMHKLIIDKHREDLHTFQKGNKQAINIIQRIAGSIASSSRTAIFPMINELMFK